MIDAGSAIIEAVINASAIQSVIKMANDDGHGKLVESNIIVWRANAAEQIEAALEEHGYKLVRGPESGFDV